MKAILLRRALWMWRSSALRVMFVCAPVEPAVEGGIAVVEDVLPAAVPLQRIGALFPKGEAIGGGSGVGGCGVGDVGLFGERGRWVEPFALGRYPRLLGVLVHRRAPPHRVSRSF